MKLAYYYTGTAQHRAETLGSMCNRQACNESQSI